jgi:hypothetical protein
MWAQNLNLSFGKVAQSVSLGPAVQSDSELLELHGQGNTEARAI